jgi:hypothetical protein
VIARRIEPWAVVRRPDAAPRLQAWHTTMGDGGRGLLVEVCFEPHPPTVFAKAYTSVDDTPFAASVWHVKGAGPEHAGEMVAAATIVLRRIGITPSVAIEDVLAVLGAPNPPAGEAGQ